MSGALGGFIGGGSGAQGIGQGVGQIGGGIAQLIYGPAAAKDLENAYNSYLQQGKQLLGQTQNNFAPYLSAGNSAASQYQSLLPQLTQGFNPTVSQLEATPGYQFELTQGQNAVNNNMAAQGLSGSGAELSALDQYSQGLANSTYQSLADIYNTNRQTTGNILNSGLSTGTTAASNLGNISNSLLGQIGTALTGYGGAQASGAAARGAGVSDISQGIGSIISAF